MAAHICVPIVEVNGEKWGDLTVWGHSHSFVGETLKNKGQISFKGNHRATLIYFKKNVHWKIPVAWDISTVASTRAPRRQLRR